MITEAMLLERLRQMREGDATLAAAVRAVLKEFPDARVIRER